MYNKPSFVLHIQRAAVKMQGASDAADLLAEAFSGQGAEMVTEENYQDMEEVAAMLRQALELWRQAERMATVKLPAFVF